MALAVAFDAIEGYLGGIGRPPTALCACELRSPVQFTDAGFCKRNIEMTPLCNIEVTLPRVLGSREVRRGGGVDEQAGVQPS